MSTPMTAAEMRQILASRKIERVVVLGANGTMGFGSAALFTQAVPQVTFLARTQQKAKQGLAAAVKQVRSPTVATRSKTGSYDADLESAVADAWERLCLAYNRAGQPFGWLTSDVRFAEHVVEQLWVSSREDADDDCRFHVALERWERITTEAIVAAAEQQRGGT